MCDKETALIKFSSDPLLAADSGESSALIPLDLSSASDTVEHAVLIDWLKFWLASLTHHLIGSGHTSHAQHCQLGKKLLFNTFCCLVAYFPHLVFLLRASI